MSRKSIIIAGCGFAGFWAAAAACRLSKGAVNITVVSPSPEIQMRPRLYEARPETLCVNVQPLFDRIGVRHVADRVTGAEDGEQAVRLEGGTVLAYDRLVVATGSRMLRPGLPGAALPYSIDTLPEAIAFDVRLKEISGLSTPPTIIVIGAGFTGIELVLELRDRLKLHNSPHSETAHLILIDRSASVDASLGPEARGIIEQALAASGTKVILGAEITRTSDRSVTLADGRRFQGDLVVLTTGLVAAPQPKGLTVERDHLGRIRVDETLRALGASDIFVAGDAASARVGDTDSPLALQSCQHALQLGRFAGENAARDVAGQPLLTYRQPRYVTCLDLGRSGAVYTEGWARTVRMLGDDAKALKRRINTEVIYPPLEAPRELLLALSETDPERRTYSAPTMTSDLPEPLAALPEAL